MTPEAAAAVSRAEAAADAQWLREAYSALLHICTVRKRGDDLTSDAVWAVLEARKVKAPREPRAIAAVFQRAAKASLIEKTDRTKESVRKECHGRPVAVWKIC